MSQGNSAPSFCTSRTDPSYIWIVRRTSPKAVASTSGLVLLFVGHWVACHYTTSVVRAGADDGPAVVSCWEVGRSRIEPGVCSGSCEAAVNPSRSSSLSWLPPLIWMPLSKRFAITEKLGLRFAQTPRTSPIRQLIPGRVGRV